MESTSAEQLPNDVEIQQNDDVSNGKSSGNPEDRQNYNTENNKVELGNLGKFSFGVSISMLTNSYTTFLPKKKNFFSFKTRNYVR